MESSLSERQGCIGNSAAPFHQIVPRAKIAELHRQAKLWTIEEQRNRADLIELYKMSRGITSVPLQKLFTLAPQNVPTRCHSWKLVKSHSSTDARRFFFIVRVINRWNNLSHISWTCPRTSWTGFGTAGWDSLGTHGPRNAMAVQCKNGDVTPDTSATTTTATNADSSWYSRTRWAQLTEIRDADFDLLS